MKEIILKTRIAVIGIGAMGSGIILAAQKNPEIEVVAISDINKNALRRFERILSKNTLVTIRPEEVLSTRPDILIDATPAVIESALLIKKALEEKINVILMNSEVDQVFGRLLANEAHKRGVILTSDAGDQHAVLVRTINEIRLMGFEVILAGNNKGYLDHYATPESIREEAFKRRLSLKQCTAYTDGTKLAIEMTLVANCTNFTLLKTGMIGPQVAHVNDAINVFDLDRARKLGGVVDYVLGAQPGGSIFVIGYTDDSDEQFYMNYYKMGKGPYYLFLRPYHLCHFETPFAIQKVMKHHEPILVQKKRVLEVGSRAKINLKAGTRLDGMGGYHLYGLIEKPGNLPIGLSEGTTLLKDKKRDEAIGWDDVEFPKNDQRLILWEEQESLKNNWQVKKSSRAACKLQLKKNPRARSRAK